MGKYLDRFKKLERVGNAIDQRANRFIQERNNQPKSFHGGKITERKQEKMGDGIVEGFGDDLFKDEFGNLGADFYDPRYGDNVGIQPAQKPESFHHFILENQYKDLERSIRGYKDIFDKQNQKWDTVRKQEHCFTDEEAEEILRTAQSHLATDIKLSFINKEAFGEMMMAIYEQIDDLFYAIAEYRYGRYGTDERQYKMKLQNRKIFLELWTRIQANYSRAISGIENKLTHQSVQGQESLQGRGERDFMDNRRYS